MLTEHIEDLCEAWALVGSRVTCNPPPTDTDQDILVLVTPQKLEPMEFELDFDGWDRESEKYDMTEFQSFRKKDWNIILTDQQPFFDKFMEATVLCTEHNYLTKEDRIACFDKVFGRKTKAEREAEIRKKIDEWYQKSVSTNNWTQDSWTSSYFNWSTNATTTF